MDPLSNVDLESSVNEDAVREGKFVNYWITTTLTRSTTVYTGTSTLASILCTPVGWPYANCPAGK